MVKSIGDGANTSIWFNDWTTFGAIHRYITYRDLYNERYKIDMSVKEFFDVSNRKWRTAWATKLPVNDVNHNIVLSSDQHDKLMWRSNDGILGKFSVKQAYKDLYSTDIEVPWCKLVWFSKNIPKFAIILWLAIQGRLTTQDKIRKWGSYDLMICPLCFEETDSHEHLFFKCKFSNGLWSKVLEKVQGQQWVNMELLDLIKQLASMYNGNAINSVVRRLCLVTCVYMIWQERNFRLFRDESRSVELIFQIVCETVKNRLSGLNVKKFVVVKKVEETWNVKFDGTGLKV
ncbi:reverse transcriptase zinc-binding domain-containing protein [Artemisia annua]|uniref:Reverse transcriptase zinc-binding domain-containing protein n=1 Tax=Artemisia annua TaxID=35608 RepID=A0A2U1NI16_ARTAN|nr:reverse transcriptase zinc-binding domain-containing protein [Artemisia annua]